MKNTTIDGVPTVGTFEKNQKKVINAWSIYDWANSAYFLVISTAIFPIYFVKYTPDVISIGPWTTTNSSLYSYAVALAYIIMAIISPILSGIADYGGRKKFFLQVFTLFGSVACMLLYFFKGEPQLWLATSAFILATIGCAGSLVFYNAYLPIIVTEDKYDKTSARGFAFGYVGSVLLLIFILLMIQKPDWFNISDAQYPARLGFLLVGVWWLGFAQISFKYLPKDKKVSKVTKLIKNGYNEIKTVFGKVKKQRNITLFLFSFFFFSAGVQTVIYLATIFAEKELAFSSSELIMIVLLLQLVAVIGAYLFAWLSGKIGNKNSLLIMIAIWFGICIAAYFTSSKMSFYIIAALVGMVMGGIQSLSRSTYSKMIDSEEEVTSYFSFFDVLFKLSIVMGTFSFGFVDNLTHNLRYSVLVLGLYFVIGFVLMLMVDKKSIRGEASL